MKHLGIISIRLNGYNQTYIRIPLEVDIDLRRKTCWFGFVVVRKFLQSGPSQL